MLFTNYIKNLASLLSTGSSQERIKSDLTNQPKYIEGRIKDSLNVKYEPLIKYRQYLNLAIVS